MRVENTAASEFGVGAVIISNATVRLIALMMGLFAAGALGQDWPTKPVRWLVPFAPGGPADVLRRLRRAALGRLRAATRARRRRPANGHVQRQRTGAQCADGR